MSDLSIGDLILPAPTTAPSGASDGVSAALPDGADSFLGLLDNRLALLGGQGLVGRGQAAPEKADALLYRPLPGSALAVEGGDIPDVGEVAVVALDVFGGSAFGAVGVPDGDSAVVPSSDVPVDNKDLPDDVVLASLLPVQILPVAPRSAAIDGQKTPVVGAAAVPSGGETPIAVPDDDQDLLAGVGQDGTLAGDAALDDVLSSGKESALSGGTDKNRGAAQARDTGDKVRFEKSEKNALSQAVGQASDAEAPDDDIRFAGPHERRDDIRIRAEGDRAADADSALLYAAQSAGVTAVVARSLPDHQQFQPLSFASFAAFTGAVSTTPEAPLPEDLANDDGAQQGLGNWLTSFDGQAVGARTTDSTGFQSLLTSFRAGAPLTPASEQVLMYVRQLANQKQTQLSVQLHPAELGRINIRLDFADGGKVKARVVADRAETLDMLQADRHGLEQALAAAGLDLDAGGMEFSLHQGNGDGPEGRTSQQAGFGGGIIPANDLLSLQDESITQGGQIDLASGVVNVKI